MKFCFIGLLASTLISVNAQDLPTGYDASQRNKESVLEYLRPTLLVVGGAGRIYYSTACAAEDGTALPFPRAEVRPPSKETIGLAAVREIFQNDKNVAVSQDGYGLLTMIRVTIGQPPSALLQTKIPSISLKEHEQYNPEFAIAAIVNSKEIEAAMRRLGFEEPRTAFNIGIVKPEKGVPLPHLPSSIKNMTMDRALDEVARTFRGIVTYETCTDQNGKHWVSVDFIQNVIF